MSDVPSMTILSRKMTVTRNARSAIEIFLSSLEKSKIVVLIPSYYGLSSREGSGVWDPLIKVGAQVVHYRVDRNLHVDLEDLERKILEFHPDVLMLIHYFGWVDPASEDIAMLAESNDVLLIEDEAHALLTDLVGRGSGTLGKAAAISINKSFDFAGGLLVENGTTPDAASIFDSVSELLGVDLAKEASRRVSDAKDLIRELKSAPSGIGLLRGVVADNVVPLNVPVLVNPSVRQRVYEGMHAAGFPVACLYYQLGPGINPVAFPDSLWLSQRMVNLPLRSPISESDLREMLDCFYGLAQIE